MLTTVSITIILFIYIVKNPARILGNQGMNSDSVPISSIASDKSLSLSLLTGKIKVTIVST